MAASEDNFILEIFLNGSFSKTAAEYIFLKNFLLWHHVKEGHIFMDFFFSKGFKKKYKQTELALDFIQKQY